MSKTGECNLKIEKNQLSENIKKKIMQKTVDRN